MASDDLWTIDELSAVVADALVVDYPGPPSGRVREVPDRRTIRWYTTIGLLDRPAAMRGRTALYGRRHLLQLVAIKRLQADGHTLAEVQRELLGATNTTLTRIARVPNHDQPSTNGTTPDTDGESPEPESSLPAGHESALSAAESGAPQGGPGISASPTHAGRPARARRGSSAVPGTPPEFRPLARPGETQPSPTPNRPGMMPPAPSPMRPGEMPSAPVRPGELPPARPGELPSVPVRPGDLPPARPGGLPSVPPLVQPGEVPSVPVRPDEPPPARPGESPSVPPLVQPGEVPSVPVRPGELPPARPGESPSVPPLVQPGELPPAQPGEVPLFPGVGELQPAPGVPLPGVRVERAVRFWAVPPVVVASPAVVSGVRISDALTLLLSSAGRVPDADDLVAITAAAGPLLAVLRQRGLDGTEGNAQ